MGNSVSLEDEMVNLRIVSKQMQRSSKKCEKNEKAALQKLKKVSHPVFAVDVFIYCVSSLKLRISIQRQFNKEIMKELESMARMQLERKTRP
jgi:hypothetical protein